MSVEENKAIARRHFEEFWTQGDLTVADEIYSTDAVGRCGSNPEQVGYPECEKDLVRGDREAFPDGVATIEDQIAEGEMVLTRWIFTGTNSGELFGNPATGRTVSVRGMHLHQIVEGRIVAVWAHPDSLSFMTQLGLQPAEAVGVT